MTRGVVEQIADAVLYEGYILYPYRPSSLKNRQRWNFGGLCPRSYSEAQNGTERWTSQTQCLVVGNDRTTIRIKLRFLHLVRRQVARVRLAVKDLSECADSDLDFVETLEVGGCVFQTWEEASECEIEVPEFALGESAEQRPEFHFNLSESRDMETLRDSDGRIGGVLIRRRNTIEGAVRIEIERFEDGLYKLTARALNLTEFPNATEASRELAMQYSLVSSHAILRVREGEFISLLDPPERYVEIAAKCENVGTYPVLVGNEDERSAMLSSPIILYDYPQVAPESAGNLFDGAEIDEILTLRILALTEEEKREMRQCDPRAREILDRIESDPDHLARLHGVMRSVGQMRGGERL